MTVLLSTAYLDEAERCDEIVLLHEGEILGQGRPAELREPLRGRTFSASSPGRSNRAFQKALAAVPGVLDAVIQADRVRIVARSGAQLAPDRLLGGIEGATIEAVEPRLEDAFVAMLRERAGAGEGRERALPPGCRTGAQTRPRDRGAQRQPPVRAVLRRPERDL